MGINTRHIVSFSGGKDSTAMLLMMLERGMQVDEVVYFDCGDWEFPQMHDHINQVEQYTGIEITRLKPKRDFNYWMFDHKFTKGKRVGVQVGYGWSSAYRRWCTRIKVQDHIDKKTRGNRVYIGFASDEAHRSDGYTQNRKKCERIFPLIEWGITEAEALQYCYDKGFAWGGLYEHFKRVSCWCCPLQSLPELRKLWKHYPELWQRLKDMDERAWNTFRIDGTTVEQLERRFYLESLQMDLFVA